MREISNYDLELDGIKNPQMLPYVRLLEKDLSTVSAVDFV